MADSEALNRNEPEIEKSVAASDMYRLLFMSLDFPTEELASGLLDGSFEKDVAAIFEELGFPAENRENIRSRLIAWKGNKKNSNQLLTEMRREYTRLFTHPKKPAVALYETTFRYDPEDELQSKPSLFISPAARDAERCYKKAGLVMSGTVNEPADHIATQMEFMMYLYLQKAKSIRASNHADLVIIEDQIREFIQAHLQK
jgi:TorA maturation chaperone TorD